MGRGRRWTQETGAMGGWRVFCCRNVQIQQLPWTGVTLWGPQLWEGGGLQWPSGALTLVWTELRLVTTGRVHGSWAKGSVHRVLMLLG